MSDDDHDDVVLDDDALELASGGVQILSPSAGATNTTYSSGQTTVFSSYKYNLDDVT